MTYGDLYWYYAKLGDLVYDIVDPRHIGRIEAIDWTNTATVRWVETGWISEDVPLSNLRKEGE